MPLRGGFEGEFSRHGQIYRSDGIFPSGRRRSGLLLRPRHPSSRWVCSQLFLSGLHSCIARLRFTGWLHFGTSGWNCKHVLHRGRAFV